MCQKKWHVEFCKTHSASHTWISKGEMLIKTTVDPFFFCVRFCDICFCLGIVCSAPTKWWCFFFRCKSQSDHWSCWQSHLQLWTNCLQMCHVFCQIIVFTSKIWPHLEQKDDNLTLEVLMSLSVTRKDAHSVKRAKHKFNESASGWI